MVGILLGWIAMIGWAGTYQKIDGEAAIDIARRHAQAQGIRDKMQLVGVKELNGAQNESEYVRFSLPDRREVRAFVSGDGHVQRYFVLGPSSLAFADNGGQAKVDALNSLLSTFGVPRPMRLQTLTISEGSDRGGYIVVEDAAKTRYSAAYSDKTDRLITVRKMPEGNIFIGLKRKDLSDPKLEALVRSWGAEYCGKEEVRLESLIEGDKKLATAFFAIQRNGYPFVAQWQHYGYGFTLTVPDGKFVALEVSDAVPPTDAGPITLSEADAVLAAKGALETQIVPQLLADRHLVMTYELSGKPSIGWLMPQGQSVAHLVWSVPYKFKTDAKLSKRAGADAIWIDAATGKYYRN